MVKACSGTRLVFRVASRDKVQWFVGGLLLLVICLIWHNVALILALLCIEDLPRL